MHDTSPYLSPTGALISLLAAILLCWPMLLTTAPLVYFDTIAYYTNGEEIWYRVIGALGMAPAPAEMQVDAAAAASPGAGQGAGGGGTLRSLAYSAFFFPSAITPLGLVLSCILQTALTLWVFLGLVPPLSGRVRETAIAGLVGFAAVGSLTTLPWFASYAMPDLLGAILPVYYALALGRADGLGRIKVIVLLAVATFAILGHYGHLPLAAGLAAGALLWRLFRKRLTLFAVGFCLVPVMLAAAFNLASSILVAAATAEAPMVAVQVADTGEIGRDAAAAGTVEAAPAPAEDTQLPTDVAEAASLAPNRYPILLARSLEDGPARWYLEDECRYEDRYAMCEVFDEIPDTIHEFLWAEDGFQSATADQMRRIRAEENEVVLGALRRYPLMQMQALASNTLLQTVTVGTGELLPVPGSAEGGELAEMRPKAADAEANATLLTFDWITFIATALATIALVWRVATGRVPDFLLEAVLMTFFALLVNAAIYGGLSAPVDRYQSRIVWLVPALLALDLALRWGRLRAGENRAVENV